MGNTSSQPLETTYPIAQADTSEDHNSDLISIHSSNSSAGGQASSPITPSANLSIIDHNLDSIAQMATSEPNQLEEQFVRELNSIPINKDVANDSLYQEENAITYAISEVSGDCEETACDLNETSNNYENAITYTVSEASDDHQDPIINEETDDQPYPCSIDIGNIFDHSNPIFCDPVNDPIPHQYCEIDFNGQKIISVLCSNYSKTDDNQADNLLANPELVVDKVNLANLELVVDKVNKTRPSKVLIIKDVEFDSQSLILTFTNNQQLRAVACDYSQDGGELKLEFENSSFDPKSLIGSSFLSLDSNGLCPTDPRYICHRLYQLNLDNPNRLINLYLKSNNRFFAYIWVEMIDLPLSIIDDTMVNILYEYERHLKELDKKRARKFYRIRQNQKRRKLKRQRQ